MSNKYDPILGEYRQKDGITGADVPSFETDPLSLHLDQTTPQSVINGQPNFVNGIGIGTTPATGNILDIYSGASQRLYVNSAGLYVLGSSGATGIPTTQEGFGGSGFYYISGSGTGTGVNGPSGAAYFLTENAGSKTGASVVGYDAGTINFGTLTGIGGVAVSDGTSNATGGKGADIVFGGHSSASMTGGASNTATTGLNTGGKGGSIKFKTGLGGGTNAGVTGTGGAGGDYTVVTNAGGSGRGTTGSTIGGAGGTGTFTAGAGGIAAVTTGARTGGDGGGWSFTSGVGGAVTTTLGTVKIGGAGGGITLTSAAGGAASQGSTSNTGGAGGSVTFQAGIGGTGTTANGANGHIIFNSGATEIARFDNTAGAVGNFRLALDNQKIQLGTAQDATITYDGTELVIDATPVARSTTRLINNATVNQTSWAFESIARADTTSVPLLTPKYFTAGSSGGYTNIGFLKGGMFLIPGDGVTATYLVLASDVAYSKSWGLYAYSTVVGKENMFEIYPAGSLTAPMIAMTGAADSSMAASFFYAGNASPLTTHVGNICPSTGAIRILGTSAQSINMGSPVNGKSNANNLTIFSGSVFATGATDKSAGDMIVSSGSSSGTGTGRILFNTATAGATGTTLRTPTTKWIIDGVGDLSNASDTYKIKFGAASDATISFDGDSLNIVANAVTAADALEFTAGSYTFNVPADTDIALNFTGTTNSGVLTWMEDEDYFKFSDAIRVEALTQTQNVEPLANDTYYLGKNNKNVIS